MHRRQAFKHTAVLGCLATGIATTTMASHAAVENEKFKLAYAPHPGMFRNSAGNDILDQIRFAADQGFTAWEDNGLPRLDPDMQTKVGELLNKLDMQMGVFVAYANFDQPTFVRPDLGKQDEVLAGVKQAVEIAKRCGAKWFTVVPGSVDQQHPEIGSWNKYGGARLAGGYQTANAIELLKRCSEILEPHDLTMVLEPLNPHANHGGVFLQRSDQAYAICKAVDSPSCKILFDIYHQQITEGNLIPNIDHCWDEIGYMQAGDNPGRKEPGTGEINYRNVFAHLHGKGFKGVIGMEHGNSQPGKAGEQAVIDAYRAADSF
jgi:hydroxypyruvate isomerase